MERLGSIVGCVCALILTISAVAWLILTALRIVGVLPTDPNVF